MKIALETLGCKLNQAETETLARDFAAAGHTLVGRNDNPDIYILNTCTVTHTADSKSRHLLRMVKRHNPDARIVVTGCYAEGAPADLEKLGEVDIVIGNAGKMSLLNHLAERGVLATPGAKDVPSTGSVKRHTRAFVKIQDGCRNFCAYCIVPYVRRNERSIPADNIIAEIEQRIAEGYQEFVLTGTRIGGYNEGKTNLTALAARILQETDITRLRLSSLQPQEISPDLLALWQDTRLCPHFHLSLQSGSARVLKKMHRRYTPGEYEKTVTLIRALVQDVAITTDVIVGFPGETDAEFAESYAFCERLGFARIHVFPFSPRTGTAAETMPGQIPENIKKSRTQKMLALAAESADNFQRQFKGTTLDVLWEQETDKGVWSGVTGNYIRVYRKDKRDLLNKLDFARID